jgi:hypothetical protein
VIRLDLALRKVNKTRAFSGFGFFGVDKTTLTAMLSTTVTYLIVLLQTPPEGVSSNTGDNCANNPAFTVTAHAIDDQYSN